MKEQILVLDFGSQTTQLIARRVRELGVFSRIVPFTTTAADLAGLNVKGLILSGGPASLYGADAPQLDPSILAAGLPVLGICYGMQAGCAALGAEVRSAESSEYGRTELTLQNQHDLLAELPDKMTVWMSHRDVVQNVPDDFDLLATTAGCSAVIAHRASRFYGLQFHPEVTHTEQGSKILENFLYKICDCSGDWRDGSFIDETVQSIQSQVRDGRVICGLSGGVDSTVTATLIDRAIGDRLDCIFVDNGLLRQGEAKQVLTDYEQLGLRVHFVDATDRFLDALDGVDDPEKKRKIIGGLFIDVFADEAKKIQGVDFLAQGTLYPDVIESISPTGGPSSVIKSHHNVGGLPEKLGFELVEPLRDLFKDEVRRIGTALSIPAELLERHPFPGPGLGIRIVGTITRERLVILRAADAIVVSSCRDAGWYHRVWQAFAVLLPVRSVGVMGDERTYEQTIAVRVVESTDGMTADWAKLPHELLDTIGSRIINEVDGINRVVYDISSKPPGTIEWE